MTKVLIVCMANICRSPMALAVAQHMLRQSGQTSALQFDSAGTHAQDAGPHPDTRVFFVLANRRYPSERRRSRRMTAQDFEHFDLIVAMDQANRDELQRQCPPQHQPKLRLLLEFAPELPVRDVPDPYYGNLAGFERTLDLCEAGVRGLIKALG
jgi:protein-tyrosine phosphatase